MNCTFDIKVVLCKDMEKAMDNLEEITHCQEVFKKTIENIIEKTGIYPIVSDWVVPLKNLEGDNYDIGEVCGRNFDPNEMLIEYEIG